MEELRESDRAGCAGAWRVLGREPRGAGDADATWPAREALGGGRPAIRMGLRRRALETETLVQPDVMQLSVEMSLCV